MIDTGDLFVCQGTRPPGTFALEAVAATLDSLALEYMPVERDRLAQALAENAARAAEPRAALQEHREEVARRRTEEEHRRAALSQPPVILRDAPAPMPTPWRRLLTRLWVPRDT